MKFLFRNNFVFILSQALEKMSLVQKEKDAMEKTFTRNIEDMATAVKDKHKKYEDLQEQYNGLLNEIDHLKEQASKDAKEYTSQVHALDELQEVVGKCCMSIHVHIKSDDSSKNTIIY